jgi:hypothetical protein
LRASGKYFVIEQLHRELYECLDKQGRIPDEKFQ